LFGQLSGGDGRVVEVFDEQVGHASSCCWVSWIFLGWSDRHPGRVGRIFYSASTMLCVPSSLSEHGPALGAQASEARLRCVVTEGGFTRFRRATETPFNLVLEARP
jgi:hypothetical protein